MQVKVAKKVLCCKPRRLKECLLQVGGAYTSSEGKRPKRSRYSFLKFFWLFMRNVGEFKVVGVVRDLVGMFFL